VKKTLIQLSLIAVLGLTALPACKKSDSSSAAVTLHTSTGVIKSFDKGGKIVVIQHEAFPNNFMAAMTMPFEAADPKLLEGFKVGDKVEFSLQSTEMGFPLVAIKKLGK
jgi:Cu/Ag efflux protein CusF